VAGPWGIWREFPGNVVNAGQVSFNVFRKDTVRSERQVGRNHGKPVGEAIKPLAVVAGVYAHPGQEQQGFRRPAPDLDLKFQLVVSECL
jgi:hypothetical protein